MEIADFFQRVGLPDHQVASSNLWAGQQTGKPGVGAEAAVFFFLIIVFIF